MDQGVADDHDNPEWTEEDFAVAQGPEALPAEVLAAFPRTRTGRPKAEAPKVAVKLRLDADVIAGFKAGGPGWQTRMNDTLKGALPMRAEITPAKSVADSKLYQGRDAKSGRGSMGEGSQSPSSKRDKRA